MKFNVTFQSSFPLDMSKHPEGEELAEYLASLFTRAGVTVTNIDNYEDFAWSLDTVVDGQRLFLLIGYVGDEVYEWLLQVRNYTGLLDMFRRRRIQRACESLSPIVHQVLSSDRYFSNIRWHKGDFAENKYSGTPDSEP